MLSKPNQAMNKITILTDYKNHFGSKWNSSPYRSGYDKKYLLSLFESKNYFVEYLPFSEVDFSKDWSNMIILYTSSEEIGFQYKKFIEDIIFGLKEAGAYLLPDPLYLRANNNKVFMEILRSLKIPEPLRTVKACLYGTYSEALKALSNGVINLPCVIKTAEGAMSRGVFLAQTENEFKKVTRRVSRLFNVKVYLKELLRLIKYKGYKVETVFQKKFIVQNFIEGLQNDWKILIYGNKYYILRRNIRKNDFRASGSHYNYSSGSESGFPLQMFQIIKDFFDALDVPNASIDFAFDGKKGYIFEFQAIYFGTSTQYKSKDYYEYYNGTWLLKPNKMNQEQIFVESIVDYLKKKNV